MSFDVDQLVEEARASDEYKPFQFTWKGEEFELPNIYLLDPGELKTKLGVDDDVEIEELPTNAVLSAVAEEAWAAVRSMPGIAQMKVIEEWEKACGLAEDDEAGKAPSQSSRPNRAARRSKQTSRSGGKTSGPSRSGK